MSGKSTFLRTAGVNVVLALAGAPVRARSDATVAPARRARRSSSTTRWPKASRASTPRSCGCGRSWASPRRAQPVLFLLDEILHGTNSHDRRIGAEAVIRSLLRYRTIGLVTTHDLALARIAEDPVVPAENVHFEDDIVDGKMRFDYRLRPGVVRKSNALALMREVGLEV